MAAHKGMLWAANLRERLYQKSRNAQHLAGASYMLLRPTSLPDYVTVPMAKVFQFHAKFLRSRELVQ